MAASDGGARDGEDAARALQLAREVAALRVRDGVRRRELSALQDKVAALSTRLEETTDELAQRAQFAADAMAQIARLEGDAATAKRALLSREMQLQDAAQEKRALETRMRSKEHECAHWEGEYQRVDTLLAEQKRAHTELEGVIDKKNRKGRQRKAQMKRLVASLDEMKQHIERLRDKERRLTRTIETKDASAAAMEQMWNGKVEQEQHKVACLQEHVRGLEEESRRAEQDRSMENEATKIREAVTEELQLEKHEQAKNLRSQLRDLEQVVIKLRTKEQLLRREVFRLREELLLSESQRTTDQRRHEQLIRGKDKEVAFIWKKYVDAVSSLPQKKSGRRQGSFTSDPDVHSSPTC